MKKCMIWITMMVLLLTLCACRPEAQTGGAGSSPEGGANATEEGGTTGEQLDENAEETQSGTLLGTEGEESAENTLIPEESEEGTEVTETVPAENEEEAEVTLPATTTEDPALRAEADRIRKEQGEEAYQDYCIEKDIKAYCMATLDDEFRDDTVMILLKKSISAQNKPAPNFSCVEYSKLEEWTAFYKLVPHKRGQEYTMTLKVHDKQGVLDAIHKLEQHDSVLMAYPAYIAINATD